MNNECVIGIDIGGTNIRIGRTDENDQLVDFKRVSSKETFKDGNISESLTEVLKNYLDKYCKNVQVKQIAIGIPATLSSDRKQILQVPNIKGMDGLFLGKELEEIEKKKKNYPFYNPVSFCYVKDEKIVDESVKLLNHLESEFEKLKSDDEAFREMISYELANHEACITCDYEPTLDSLGLKFEDLTTSQKQIVKQELKKQIDRYC